MGKVVPCIEVIYEEIPMALMLLLMLQFWMIQILKQSTIAGNSVPYNGGLEQRS
jgi:hypothetical protein